MGEMIMSPGRGFHADEVGMRLQSLVEKPGRDGAADLSAGKLLVQKIYRFSTPEALICSPFNCGNGIGE